MNLRDVAHLRLRNQRVSGGQFKSAEEVVRWLGCVQSQEYAVAKWSLAQRASGFSDADIDELLGQGRILRTHILRPTWHFVLPSDIRWMMRLTGPRVCRLLRSQVVVQGVPERAIEAGLDVIREALVGGRRLNRKQLVQILIERGAVTDQMWTIPIFIRAELDLVIASGGLVGKQQTYTLLDEIAPSLDAGAAEFDRDWALAELTRRFFTGHGPATMADFNWWSSLTVADTRRGLELNADALEKLEVDGTTFWWAGDDGGDTSPRAAAADRSAQVHLMQAYDEYIVAYRSPRKPINVDGLVHASAMSRPPFLHALIVDTQLVGWWRRVSAGDGYRIEVRLARPLNAAERRRLEAEVERYGRFVGVPVSLAPTETLSAGS